MYLIQRQILVYVNNHIIIMIITVLVNIIKMKQINKYTTDITKFNVENVHSDVFVIIMDV
jgi:hypothetical protein